MIFTDIRLQNYRSYQDDSFELGSGVNIVVGPNAIGKTNLLEALLMVSVGRSYRAKDRFLINNSCDWSRISAHTTENQTRIVKLKKIDSEKIEKTFNIESKEYKKFTNNLKQPVVLFQPDDLLLMMSEPVARRTYLDNLLELTTPGYEKYLNSYNRVIAQRNALLKNPKIQDDLLFAIDLRLCDLSAYLVSHRLYLLDKFDEEISDVYSSISGYKMNVKIKYLSKTNLDNYSSSLMNDLKNNYHTDRLRGYTSRGPHRDDFEAYFDNYQLIVSASRGENRTFVLALKIIEQQILESKIGIRPLLLLDDVFSELDSSRRRFLTKYLEDHQVLITTTDADVIAKNFTRSANMILL